MKETILPPALYDYQERPKLCKPDDFWSQVRRTANGEPVDQKQIDILTQSVLSALTLKKIDIVLDLCCGNGAFSATLFPHCYMLLGVDLSSYLIDVGQVNFQHPPNFMFYQSDIINYLLNEQHPEKFTKALCVSAFQYLSPDSAENVLNLLLERFTNIKKMYFMEMPDRDKFKSFFNNGAENMPSLDEHTTSFGIWRTKEAFCAMGERAGWTVNIIDFPSDYHSAHYRFNALLQRQ